MFGEVLFFEYIAAIFLGLSGLAIVMMCLMHGDNKRAKAYRAMITFMIFSFLVGASFFTFYYREVILRIDNMGFAGRMVDYSITIGFTFVWIRTAYIIIDRQRLAKLYFWTKVLFIIDWIVECGMAVFMLDSKYYVEGVFARNVAITGHIVFTIIIVIFVMIYLVEGMREIIDRKSRRFVFLNSILIIILEITTMVFSIEFSYGVYVDSAWEARAFDPTGILMITVNLITILFVYKMDFSPLFFSTSISSISPRIIENLQTIENLKMHEDKIEEEKSDFSIVIDHIAQAHHLTIREREVMILAYNGYTNPNIAEKLDISLNTAKRHMHNIFEKLDVNTRVELVHMINSQV